MAQARDPQCGMMVDTATAERWTDKDGETVYFCSNECKTKFTEALGKKLHFGSAGSGGLEYEGPPGTTEIQR